MNSSRPSPAPIADSPRAAIAWLALACPGPMSEAATLCAAPWSRQEFKGSRTTPARNRRIPSRKRRLAWHPRCSGASFGDGPPTAMGAQIGSQLAYSQVPDEPTESGYGTGGVAYDTGGTPYPTGGMPYATGGMPYPTGGAAYPTGGTPYDTGAATAYAPGYSAAPGSGPLQTPFTPLGAESNVPAADSRPRLLLVGSSLAGVAVVALAAAAVSVAINVRPTASEVAAEPDAVPAVFAPYVGAVPDAEGQSVVVVPPPPAEFVPNPLPAVVYSNAVVPSRNQGGGPVQRRNNPGPVNQPDPRIFEPRPQFQQTDPFGRPIPLQPNPFAGVDATQIVSTVTIGVVGGLEALNQINQNPIFNPFDPFNQNKPKPGQQSDQNGTSGTSGRGTAAPAAPAQAGTSGGDTAGTMVRAGRRPAVRTGTTGTSGTRHERYERERDHWSCGTTSGTSGIAGTTGTSGETSGTSGSGTRARPEQWRRHRAGCTQAPAVDTSGTSGRSWNGTSGTSGRIPPGRAVGNDAARVGRGRPGDERRTGDDQGTSGFRGRPRDEWVRETGTSGTGPAARADGTTARAGSGDARAGRVAPGHARAGRVATRSSRSHQSRQLRLFGPSYPHCAGTGGTCTCRACTR